MLYLTRSEIQNARQLELLLTHFEALGTPSCVLLGQFPALLILDCGEESECPVLACQSAPHESDEELVERDDALYAIIVWNIKLHFPNFFAIPKLLPLYLKCGRGTREGGGG